MSGVYQLDGTESKEVIASDVDCGKCLKTVYRNTAGKVVRQDIEIIVDPEKLPKVGAEVHF